MKTIAETIAHELKAAGVQYVFGQPGGEVVELIEALAQEDIEFVLMGLESAAALAAATLGQATGVPGVCLTTLGPGACNLALGLGDAFLDRHPLIAISARTNSAIADWYNHQHLDLNAMYAPITKASIALDGVNTAQKVRDAIALTQEHTRGPVYLTLPGNMASDPEQETALQVEAKKAPLNSAAALAEISRRLNVAQTPIAVVGIALDQHDPKTVAAVQSFLAATGIPYADTPKTKGLVDPTSPNFLGTYLSASGDRVINSLIEDADCVLGIGYDPVETTYQWHLKENYVGVAAASTAYGTYQPEFEAIGDVPAMLNQLEAQYDAESQWSTAQLDTTREAVEALITPPLESSKAGIAPIVVSQILRTILPENTQLCVDTGQHKMIMAQVWQTSEPLTYFNSNGLSSMSTAVPGAIALALHDRDRPVACVSGDGGFAMMVQELETVQRLGIAPLFVVFVDQALSLIRIPQQMRNLPSRGIDLSPVDWATVAQGFGVEGQTITTIEELTSALDGWVNNKRALVLAVKVDEALYAGNTY